MSMSQAERDAEDKKWEKERPTREWKKEIAATDKEITARVIEEIFDALSESMKEKISKKTKDKFKKRKTIRQRKGLR